jgi:hypothetical protein
MKLNCLVYVRQNALLLKSVLKALTKCIKREPSKMMTRGMERQYSPLELDGVIQI